jgi:hypothetical protein
VCAIHAISGLAKRRDAREDFRISLRTLRFSVSFEIKIFLEPEHHDFISVAGNQYE